MDSHISLYLILINIPNCISSNISVGNRTFGDRLKMGKCKGLKEYGVERVVQSVAASFHTY